MQFRIRCFQVKKKRIRIRNTVSDTNKFVQVEKGSRVSRDLVGNEDYMPTDEIQVPITVTLGKHQCFGSALFFMRIRIRPEQNRHADPDPGLEEKKRFFVFFFHVSDDFEQLSKIKKKLRFLSFF